MRRLGWMALAAGVASSFVCAAALADIAMPRDRWSPIRMASESVKLTLSPAKVTVEATFVLENEKEAVTAVIGYPRGVLEKSLDGFAATVDGEKVEVTSQSGKSDGVRDMGAPPGGRGGKGGKEGALKSAYQFAGPYPEWKTFEVKFGARQKRTVVVSYSVAPAEVQSDSGKLLTYVYTMKTGAAWSGKIDKAVVEADISDVNVVSTTPAKAVKKMETMRAWLAWTFKDFKPTQDIEITFKAPK